MFTGKITFLHGDGNLFSHPLAHLGKTMEDLPVLAIDSFRHMYIFPNMTHLDNPTALESFVEDLYSGKLHHEFHYGTDGDYTSTSSTALPDSVFVNLQPSEHRYTLLRDEL